MISLKCHSNNVRNLTRNLLRPVILATRRIKRATEFVLIPIQQWIAQGEAPFDGFETDGIFPVFVATTEKKDKLFFIARHPSETDTEAP